MGTQSLLTSSSSKYDMTSNGGFQMGPIQVIVKVEDCEDPVVVRPPTPVDSMADTMYFLTMMKQEREEQQRKAQDEKIVKLAMEQKRKTSLNSRYQSYRI